MEGGRLYQRNRATEVTDEGLYHHLIRTGRFRDPDKQFALIRATSTLSRLRPGTMVTVCREMGLGDVLMVCVVIRALKAAHPRLTFRLATGRAYLPLLHEAPWLDAVESLMDMRGPIANVIDLRDVPERHPRRESMDRIDIFALTCGVSVSDYTIPIAPVTDEQRARVRKMIGPGAYIALAARGSTHVRTWPLGHVQAFAKLAAVRGWTVVVLDPAAVEMPAHPGIKNLTGQVSLMDAKAVIAESDFCVSTDSGLQHLAEAVGTRCLAIYSTIPPRLRLGRYQHVRALWRESLPCVPCHDRGCPAAPCMQVAPEIVLRGIDQWDRLGMSTNVDAPGCILSAAPIEVAAESRIMGAWPLASW
jgi:ADP-heptose:LPS heptosyltransferase